MKKFLAVIIVVVLAVMPMSAVLTASASAVNNSLTNYIVGALKATHYYNFAETGTYNGSGYTDPAIKASLASAPAFKNLVTGKFDAVMMRGLSTPAANATGFTGVLATGYVLEDYTAGNGPKYPSGTGARKSVPYLNLANPASAYTAGKGLNATDTYVQILDNVIKADQKSITISFWATRDIKTSGREHDLKLFAFGKNQNNCLFGSPFTNSYHNGNASNATIPGGNDLPNIRTCLAVGLAAGKNMNERPFFTPDLTWGGQKPLAADGKWTHVVVVYDYSVAAGPGGLDSVPNTENPPDSRIKLYVNGILCEMYKDTTAASGAIGVNPRKAVAATLEDILKGEGVMRYHIGLGLPEPPGDTDAQKYSCNPIDVNSIDYFPPMNGKIADFAVFDYALSKDQIAGLLNATLNGVTSGGTVATTAPTTAGPTTTKAATTTAAATTAAPTTTTTTATTASTTTTAAATTTTAASTTSAVTTTEGGDGSATTNGTSASTANPDDSGNYTLFIIIGVAVVIVAAGAFVIVKMRKPKV